ncbi:DUF1569 domain-containing protein [Algibacter lectus]|uniref:Uncharacterized protein DUF1569 n=1 Tax=Algibacter lectus TaxID=221126 RepID=A0A4R8ME64_9FLAO|nr:DUF1569 domain-containing protein [Algibacter lectus]MWW24128.1 DUF1569 domain-containing protein [Algibacter lectus]TDY62146.1 uncharacterized protein DUF1569 [Algibacter lectus]
MSIILTEMLFKLEKCVSSKDKKSSQISKSTIGWHLDHALKVINSVSEQAIDSNPETYKSNFSFMRVVLFKLGFFPRGKARAPKSVRPPETIVETEIHNQLQVARTHIKKLETLPENAYFNHPMFGMLNKKQTVRFLEIHTNHHLKIIRDILKS